MMPNAPEDDKRSGHDRRELDVGPPYGIEERREKPERRIPEVEEVEFDECINVPPPAPPAISSSES
jgi:hypothetical protein